MARQILVLPERENLGSAFAKGVQGFVQGKELRRKDQERSLADALTNAKLRQLNLQNESLNQPVPEGFVRLPDGTIVKDPTFETPLTRAISSASTNLLSSFNGGGDSQLLEELERELARRRSQNG